MRLDLIFFIYAHTGGRVDTRFAIPYLMRRAAVYWILCCVLAVSGPARLAPAEEPSKGEGSSGSTKAPPVFAKRVDLNLAASEEIGRLPGVTPQVVERIIRNRPYKKMDELVTRKVIGKKQFAQIREYIVVGSNHK